MGKILIIDDDPATGAVLFEILQRSGHEVQYARDGQMALDALHDMATLPFVILLDLVMPVMDGWQFRRAQLEDPRLASVPVIFLSGTTTLESDVSPLGSTAILKKPVSIEELRDLITGMCRQKELSTQLRDGTLR